MTTTEQRTRWYSKGRGYGFCNCAPGCGCNFHGFPTSADGSCRAMVGNHILEGSCGDVDLSGVKAIAVIDWPKAIHDGNGKVVFIVAPETTDEQIQCLSQINTGQLGGDPWGDPGHDVRGCWAGEGTDQFRGHGRDGDDDGRGSRACHGRHLQEPSDRRAASGADRFARRLHLEEG
jgi:hypothetical protein